MKLLVFTTVAIFLPEIIHGTTVVPDRFVIPSTPHWHASCSNVDRQQKQRGALDKSMWGRRLYKGLRKVKHDLNITMENFKIQLINESEIWKDSDGYQNAPHWVPGMGNVLILFEGRSTRLQVSGYLPKLHTELQKFAVALEAIIQNEARQVIVIDVYTKLIQFLCEVEENLTMLKITVPAPRVQRSLMTDDERNLTDEKRLLFRDWGILIKYRDYLHYWSVLLSRMENRRKRTKSQKFKAKKSHE